VSLRTLEAEAETPEPPARAGSSEDSFARQAGLRGLQLAVGLGLLGAWQLASGWLIDPFFISSPTEVGARLWRWAHTGSLVFHLSYTMFAMVLGFCVGASAGFAVGFLFGRSARTAAVFDPYITALYCVPKIALAPLFIMWFGIGIESKVAMSALIVFFLVFLNTYSGVRDVNPLYLHALSIMGASPWQLLRYAILPSAMSWVLTGLKISVPYALIGTVVGEFMSSNRGIGFLIAQASGIFDTAGVFAGLVVLAVVGALLNAGLKRLERHLMRWRVTG
jgi:NitT/TauT family transport system permease protein